MRALAVSIVLALAAVCAHAEDKVNVIMPWTAEAEQGGFYQAEALGIYKRYGLGVTIHQGGPQLNTGTMLAGGAVDFRIGSNGGTTINFAARGVPAVTVAPIFQKEPSVLIAHPAAGLKTMADMKGKPIAVSQSVLVTWWR